MVKINLLIRNSFHNFIALIISNINLKKQEDDQEVYLARICRIAGFCFCL